MLEKSIHGEANREYLDIAMILKMLLLSLLQETASTDALEAQIIMDNRSQRLIKTTTPLAITVLRSIRAGTGTIGVAAVY